MHDFTLKDISRRGFLKTTAGLGAGAALGAMLPSAPALAADKTLDMWWWGEQELPGLQAFVNSSIAGYKEATVKAMLQDTAVVISQFQTAAAAGNAPDIQYLWNGINHMESVWFGYLRELDGLVNAAGIVALGSIENLDFATWRRVLSINLDGTFLGCKYAFPLLKPRGGSVVNLSSVSALVGGHNLAAYNASKGGVSLLTKYVALLGARSRPPIRCNAVCPSFLEGPMVDDIAKSARDPAAAMDKMSAGIPLGRMGKPSEVAALCLYLLSDEAAFITGADLPIDGGLTAR